MKFKIILLAFAEFFGIGGILPAKYAIHDAGAPFTFQESTKSTNDSRAEARDVFADVKPSLLKQTQVPLRLPSFLPDDGDKDSPIYAILVSADQRGYEVQLAWTEDCNGGNACHYGNVGGSVNPPVVEKNRKRVPLTLKGGIKGYFIPSTCGAHCDDSLLGWSENGYHYSISLKAEKMKVMVKVVNSAIIAPKAK